MATPSLNLFPSLDQVERRREELDELIKKSMEARPARSYHRERHGVSGRRTTSRSRSRAPLGDRELKLSTTPMPTEPPKAEQLQPQLQTQLQLQSAPQLQPQTQSQPQPQLQPQPQPSPEVLRSQTVPLPEKQNAAVVSDVVPAVPLRRRPSLDSRPVHRPTEFNPNMIKTDPLPPTPANAGLKRTVSRSPMKQPPRRVISVRNSGRDRTSMQSSTTRSSTFSPNSSVPSGHFPASHFSVFSPVESEVTNPSIYGDYQFGPGSKQDEANFQQEVGKSAIHTVERMRAETEIHVSVPPPPPRTTSRTSYQNPSVASPPRDTASRTSHRYQERNRVASPDPTLVGDSPNSLRASHGFMDSPEDFYMPDKHQSMAMKSTFPIYETVMPAQPLQSPKPFQPPPAQLPVAERPSPKAPSEAAFNLTTQVPSVTRDISEKSSLEGLWNISNGQITAHIDGPFKLRMFRADPSARRKDKLVFGTSESDPFYSVCQSHPGQDADDDEPHEALIYRHHASEDDLLPISHMQLHPPPAPTTSRVSRQSVDSFGNKLPNHITTITPILATLHALDLAAKTPQAHTLALVDPKAESPAAAKMAERAVRAAADRESCTLSWTATSPRAGRYELHHPNLGVFAVAVDGDVKCAVNTLPGPHIRRPTASIAIMNPFADFKPPTIDGSTPMTGTFGIARGSGIGFLNRTQTSSQKPGAELARLDFSNDVLYIDAPAIQALGNIYLLDICISTILAVTIAEAQRPVDPGLVFDAPPMSLALINKGKGRSRLFSGSSSSTSSSSSSLSSSMTNGPGISNKNASSVSLVLLPRRSKNNNKSKTVDWSNGISAVMGIDNLIDTDDLPRITRGILSVLGAGFKTALWLLEFGVKVSAKMVIGLSKLAEKL